MKPKPLDLEFKEILRIVESDIGDYRKAYEIEKFIKQRIKSACEFYLRYRNKPRVLIKEHPEYVEDVKEFLDMLDNAQSDEYDSIMIHYNEWLFKLAFREVLKEG